MSETTSMSAESAAHDLLSMTTKGASVSPSATCEPSVSRSPSPSVAKKGKRGAERRPATTKAQFKTPGAGEWTSEAVTLFEADGETVIKRAEDEFKWRKYGQKHVKGHSFPRSYFKCSFNGCNAKKQVEVLSRETNKDGQVEVREHILHRGKHNHPPPRKHVPERKTKVTTATPLSFARRTVGAGPVPPLPALGMTPGMFSALATAGGRMPNPSIPTDPMYNPMMVAAAQMQMTALFYQQLQRMQQQQQQNMMASASMAMGQVPPMSGMASLPTNRKRQRTPAQGPVSVGGPARKRQHTLPSHSSQC